jgi:cytochrome c biogenesis protein CcdA
MKYLFFLLMTVLSFSGVFGGENNPVITYYGEIGCNHCDLFEDKILPSIEKESGVNVDLYALDILNSQYYEECESSLMDLDLEFTIFPVLFVGNNAYLGNSAIEKGLLDELVYYKKNGIFRPFSSHLSTSSGSVSFSVFAVLFAGLVDGVNPCAFTTLVFFISFLSVQGRSKREIFITGILFSFSVFLAYFFLGLGLLNTIRLFINTSLLRFILKLLVSIVTGVFLILSIRDFYLASSGRFTEITLQLSMPIKKKIHSVIRKNNENSFLFGGVIITGLFVSIIELACTGQVYIPTIAYMIQTDSTTLGIRSLLIYNTGFILPLLIVFGAVFFGISSKILSEFFTKNIHYSKLLLSILFLFLAVTIWLV